MSLAVAVAAFAEDEVPAGALARDLGVPLRRIELHAFPDGETVVEAPTDARTVLLYRSFDRPNPKLMPLLQACDAWRRSATRRLVLAAPYMPYLRQDRQFRPGQPVSRDLLGEILGQWFARIVTVDPHLHRTRSLGPVFAPAQVDVLSAAPALAEALGRPADVIVVGPDEEAGPWAEALARELEAPHLTFGKVRRSDREVDLTPPSGVSFRGRRVVLVDDICSSGATLEAALLALRAAGAAHVDVAVTHALFDSHVRARLMAAGAAAIVASDSCEHLLGQARLHRILAAALADELGADEKLGMARRAPRAHNIRS